METTIAGYVRITDNENGHMCPSTKLNSSSATFHDFRMI